MASGIALCASAALPVGVGAAQICCVPYVGSTTPAVIADGIMQSSIDWSALAEDLPRCCENLSSPTTEQQVLLLRAAALEARASRGRVALSAFLTATLRMLDLSGIIEAHKRGETPRTTDPHESSDMCGSSDSRSAMLAAVLAVGATHDWYVLPTHSISLRRALARVAARLGPAELDWVAGGHAAAFISRGTHQVSAIKWALEAVDAAREGRRHCS